MERIDLPEKEIKKMLLETVAVCVSRILPDYEIRYDIDTAFDLCANDMVVRLSAYLMGQHSEVESVEESYREYPSDWFQMLKERFFPGFLIKQFPINYTKVLVRKNTVNKITKICPHIGIPANDRRHFEFFLTEGS